MFQLSKKLFVLTLVCLTIVFYSSLYPSIEPLGRLPEQR
ncbi:putative transmembrane protein [Rhizoctonia solani 123E]|uniref:Putative transmembrane protein n=2 Tax=Rhizoctonia solani AG-3 TaxID=1086053 RepID=A0A074SIB9_9AGAM|nr:putative transmembrane protein [Rhizoctonia solani 123E]